MVLGILQHSTGPKPTLGVLYLRVSWPCPSVNTPCLHSIWNARCRGVLLCTRHCLCNLILFSFPTANTSRQLTPAIPDPSFAVDNNSRRTAPPSQCPLRWRIRPIQPCFAPQATCRFQSQVPLRQWASCRVKLYCAIVLQWQPSYRSLRPHKYPSRCLHTSQINSSREIEKGDTYPMTEPLPFEAFGPYWFGIFGAIMLQGNISGIEEVHHMARQGHDWEKACLGSFYIKPNYPGRSSHVCNGGFLVTDGVRNRGIGRLMGETYLEWAPRLVRGPLQILRR